MGGRTVSSGIPDESSSQSMTIATWPIDTTAAQRLKDYFLQRTSGSHVLLDGRELDFRGADLNSIDLEGARVMRATLDGVNLRGANLSDADLSYASAVGTHFDGADAMGADFSHVNASTASFVLAELSGVEATQASFTSANFRGASLGGTVFWECVMASADLRDTLLERTMFFNSQIEGIQVAGASGTASGPCHFANGIVLDGQDLERWFRDRGADVSIVPMDPRE
jgi:uncharacterized protein YjbI with pentapeptide repeats